MTRGLILVLACAVVAAGVWYAVTRFPIVNPPTVEQPVQQVDIRAAPEPPTLPALGPLCGSRCGVQRWAVKTMSDPTRDLVDLRPIATTVESLAVLPREPGSDFQRGGSAERHVFVVEGFLAGWSPQADQDYHVIVFGLSNQRLSLIAEIPHPACSGACQSGFAQQYAAARAALEACVQRPNPQDRPTRVRVEGVGFFDRNHGQIGNAPNYIELHPVLRLACLP